MEEQRRWPRVLVPALLVGTAALLMVAGLGSVERIIFDETYYVNDARDFLEQGVEEGFVVHPPLGKLLIAASIRIVGDTPLGWRLLGALAGVATVLLVYLIGRRLFDRIAPAALGAFLVAVDGVFLVQARTAMLDIYLAFFTVLGAWLLLVDHQRVRAADDALLAAHGGISQVERLPRRDRRFLALAGVAFGCAVAVKWSGLLGLGAAGLAVIGWELGRRKRLTGRWLRQAGAGTGVIAATLVAVPLVTYGLTWIPWFASFETSYQGGKACEDPDDCAVPLTSQIAHLGRFHQAIYDFHRDLEADHSYRAPAYTWPVLARPVVYYYETCSEDRANRVPTTNDDGEEEIPEPCIVEQGQAAEMLAVGNPALWWGFLGSLGVLALGVARRDRRVGLPLLFALAQFVPWLVVSRPVFSFYAVPIVPFLALGLAAAVARLYDRLPVAAGALSGAAGAVVGAGLIGLWDLVGGAPTRAVYGLTAAAVGLASAFAWGLWRTGPDPLPSSRPTLSGRAVLGVLAVVAAGLAIFFLPIWLGVPLDEDAVRLRWWFRGWI